MKRQSAIGVTLGVLLFVPLVLAGLASCNQSSVESPPTFITESGTFTFFNEKLTIEVVPEEDGRINYTVARDIKVGPTEVPIQQGSNWFIIFPASADVVWAYHGDEEHVLRYEYSEPENKFTITSNEQVVDMVQNAPVEFLQRLPPNLKRD